MTPAAFIELLTGPAQACAKKTGVPAGFTVAQAALESAWGMSKLALNGMNLFGVKADASWTGDALEMPTREHINGADVTVVAKWRKYSSWQECIDDHAAFLIKNRRYAGAFAYSGNSAEFARQVAKAGYATDPAYASKLVSIIQNHNLAALDAPVSAAVIGPTPAVAAPKSKAVVRQTSTGGDLMFPILAAVLPSLINAAPDLIRMFGNSSNPVVERNASVVQKVAEMAMQVTGGINAQDAAEKIQADPAVAEKWRAAVAENMDQWLGMITKLSDLEEKSRATAKDFILQYDRSAVVGKFTFVEFLSLIFVLVATAGGAYVLQGDFTSEIKGAVITLMLIGGYTGVKEFWLGSSMGSMVKNAPAPAQPKQ